ncbi:MFS transporter [Oceanobacillus neutriphilus]|uniref:MFS transporter n=1 Tax=Oceanobacillus neutriphilus TaxID=531815 RepID=A0ABQ2P1F8_9BACI|nr:MFS transporter [Oceanobacillus neutriphilus]GGP15835.1 MFS transporter [Oceanobacillus neutriphilus]
MSNNMSNKMVDTKQSKPTKQRVLLMTTIFLGIFVAYMDRSNVSVLVADPKFLNDLGIAGDQFKIGMIMTSFLMAFGIASLVGPPLINFMGPRKAMVLGMILWFVSSILGATAFTFTTIIISRIILGIGEGVSYPQSAVYIKNWIPPQDRGKANTTWVVGQSLSLAATTPIIAFIIAAWGWRESYVFLIIATIIPMYLFWFHTTDKPKDHKKVNKEELEYIEEGLAREPIKEITKNDTFKEKFLSFGGKTRFWMLVIWYMLMNFNGFGIQTWLPTYLSDARGFSWGAMGFLASLPFIFLVFFKIMAGWLTDKTSRKAIIIFLSFSALLAGGSIYFAVSIPNNYVAAALIAFGYAFSGMANGVIFVLLQDIVPARTIGVAHGVLTGFGFFFSSLSPMIMGYAISFGDYDTGLYLLVVANIIAAIISFILSFLKVKGEDDKKIEVT